MGKDWRSSKSPTQSGICAEPRADIGYWTTTNLVFSEWDRIFKDPMTTLAAIDRVVHHSVVLDLMAVESYRAKAAGAKSKTRVAAEPAAV